jgi:Na+/H+-dicarboxylate symporter
VNTVAWLAVVTISWLVVAFIAVKILTKRSWKQLLSYVTTVYPTGFGTGGSYDTLAVNLLSAEKDLGLTPRVSEVSIVFGTVLNKSAATMGVLLSTISVTHLMDIPFL